MRWRWSLIVGGIGLARVATLAGPAGAQVYSESNFGSFVYPSHTCGAQPQVPFRPPEFRSHREVQDYNARVELYSIEQQRFTRCINDYIERTRLDGIRIQEKAEEAVRDAGGG